MKPKVPDAVKREHEERLRAQASEPKTPVDLLAHCLWHSDADGVRAIREHEEQIRQQERARVAEIQAVLADLHSAVDVAMGDSDLDNMDPLTQAMANAAILLSSMEGRRGQ